jgi:hypothetical protein
MTTKAEDWGKPDQGEAAARTTREETRGADWLSVRREAALGCLLYFYLSAPDMWVRIVGPQYAVRWYWDQETDKRGWFYSGVWILFLKSYWRRLYDR